MIASFLAISALILSLCLSVFLFLSVSLPTPHLSSLSSPLYLSSPLNLRETRLLFINVIYLLSDFKMVAYPMV